MLTIGGDSAWEVLEQFGLDLQQCDQSRRQVRLAVEAIHDCLDADAVYWCGGPGDGFEQTGTVALTEAWCRDFLARVQADEPAVLASFLDPAERPAAPWPCSAAVVRLGKGGEDWLAALSFPPHRLFQPIDVKIMRLVRRMLLGQRARVERECGREQALAGLTGELSATLDTLLANVLRASRDADVLDHLWDCRQKLNALRAGNGPEAPPRRPSEARAVTPPSVSTMG